MNKNVKVGIFFVVALLILLAVFDFVGGNIPFLGTNLHLKTYFVSIGELREGSLVKLEGYEVGKVNKIRLADRRIEVEMTVKKDSGIKIDSVATIKLTSLLGTSYINLSYGGTDSPLAGSGAVLPSEEPADINDILVKVNDAVGSIQSALSAFDVLGENKQQLTSIVNNLNSVLAGLQNGEGTFGKLLKDDTLYNEAQGVFANVNDITSSLKAGKGTLGKLLKDDTLYEDAKTALTGLGNMSEKISNSKGTIGKLLNDDTLYNQATGAATSLNQILEKINSGKGTLGQLVNDDKLYRKAQDTLLKVDKSVDTLDDLAPLGVFGTALGVVTLF
jgi:phospholipid/cholesterol/gamma-HCH transport system substrate-binding protein